MTEPGVAPNTAVYLEQVGRLLSDLDEEDRTNLLRDLADQLEDITDAEATHRLGSPEEFVAEYRRSAGLEEPKPQPHRRSMSRNLVPSLLVVGGVLLLLVVVLALSIPSGSVTTSEDGTHALEIAMLSVPVAEIEPLVESPDQFLGVPHPDPEFDTSGLGPDLTLQQDTSDLPVLDPDEVLRAVYLGDNVDGDPYYIWHSGSPDLRRMIGQIIADFGAVGRLQTSYGTVAVGEALWENSQEETNAEMGLTTGSILTESDEGTTFTAEWHALPEEVAVVVLYQDGEPVAWQSPVSGSAAFQFVYGLDADAVGLDGEMVALTATGEEWNRFVLFPG